jgi:hypothetical protein
VVTTGQYSDLVLGFENLVDEAVFLIDSTRPAAGKIVFQSFWLTSSLVWRPTSF